MNLASTVPVFQDFFSINTTIDRRQSKTLILSMNVDHTSLETEFSIAICRLTSDKWQSKKLFIAISDPHSSFVKSAFDATKPV